MLNNIKEQIKAWENSHTFILKGFFFLFRYFWHFLRVVSRPVMLKQYFYRIIYRKNFHQVSHFTEFNRYPDLFRIVQEHFSDRETLRLLSFGCSTGEEVFTLHDYFPGAVIVGTDISPWCLSVCRSKNRHLSISFLHPLSGEYTIESPFDAIFVLAVLQHYSNREAGRTTAKDYLFEKFEAQIIELDQKLKIDGLLIIDQADFDFRETRVYYRFAALENTSQLLLRDRPLYDKNNHKISDQTMIPRVFIKMK